MFRIVESKEGIERLSQQLNRHNATYYMLHATIRPYPHPPSPQWNVYEETHSAIFVPSLTGGAEMAHDKNKIDKTFSSFLLIFNL